MMGYQAPAIDFGLELNVQQFNDALRAFGGSWAWAMDANLRFCSFSPHFHDVTGRDPCDLLGKRRHDLNVREADKASLVKNLEDMEERRPFRDFTYGHISHDGRLRYYKISGDPIWGRNGEFIGYCGIGTDITSEVERQSYFTLVEAAKVESDRRIRAIFNGGQAVTVLLLQDGVVIEINSAALSFRKLPRETVTGRTFWETPWFAGVPDASVRSIQDLIERAAMGERATAVVPMPDHGGLTRRFSCVASPVVSQSGIILYVVFEAYDMTDFFLMQERNRALELEILQAQKMESLGTLAGGIAHEINTPMQYIGDNLRFALESFEEALGALTASAHSPGMDADGSYLTEEIPQALREALEGASRVQQIVAAIKLFSHPDSASKQPYDLGEAIRTTITISRNQWKYVADVETDIQDIPPVPCFAGEINQVLLNLVINAAHAIEDAKLPGPGLVTVGLRRQGDWAVITIADNGCGIPLENLSRIYDLFFTTKPPGRGTGQGLAISHSIVTRKHGGTLTCASEVGRGTTFTIALPLSASAGGGLHE